MGVSPPQMHITGISCPSTFIQHKSELHSPLCCGATTAQRTVLQVMFITLRVLTRSCCEIITPQLHRHTGAVESFLNYPQTEYGAPTSSSLLDRTGTKMDFESSRHVDLVMFTYYTCYGVPCTSVSVSDL